MRVCARVCVPVSVCVWLRGSKVGGIEVVDGELHRGKLLLAGWRHQAWLLQDRKHWWNAGQHSVFEVVQAWKVSLLTENSAHWEI